MFNKYFSRFRIWKLLDRRNKVNDSVQKPRDVMNCKNYLQIMSKRYSSGTKLQDSLKEK